jgi:hypothetical protein
MLLRTGSRRRLRLVPPAEQPCQAAKHVFWMRDAGVDQSPKVGMKTATEKWSERITFHGAGCESDSTHPCHVGVMRPNYHLMFSVVTLSRSAGGHLS